MGDSFVIALGLLLILEGVVPLILPALWKETFRRIIGLEDGQLRFVGLMAVVAGVAVLLAMHAF